MHFSGNISLPCDLINHMADGRLTTNEFAVYAALTILADSKIGASHTDADILQTFAGMNSVRAAREALNGLVAKRYIFLEPKHKGFHTHSYYVHGYLIDAGVHAGHWVDLSQVFATNDPSQVVYVKAEPNSSPTWLEPASTEHNARVGTRLSTHRGSQEERDLRDLSRLLSFIGENPGSDTEDLRDWLGMSTKRLLDVLHIAGSSIVRVGTGFRGDPYLHYLKGKEKEQSEEKRDYENQLATLCVAPNASASPSTTIDAALDFSEHLAATETTGEAILAKLPVNATHGDLKQLIDGDHQRLYALAGLPVSQSKGAHEAC